MTSTPETIELSAAALHDALKATLLTVDKRNTEPVLNSVKLDVAGPLLTAVSTDRCMLTRVGVPVADEPRGGLSFLASAADAKRIVDVLKPFANGETAARLQFGPGETMTLIVGGLVVELADDIGLRYPTLTAIVAERDRSPVDTVRFDAKRMAVLGRMPGKVSDVVMQVGCRSVTKLPSGLSALPMRAMWEGLHGESYLFLLLPVLAAKDGQRSWMAMAADHQRPLPPTPAATRALQ